MRQYNIEKNKLILKVEKTPLFVRTTLFVFSILFFLLPLASTITSIVLGNGFHITFLIGIFIFSIMGFYLLRIALWNTYGKEEITFNGSNIEYFADYGWFKDSIKPKEIVPLVYSIRQIGYEEDKKGALVIGKADRAIECVTKMKSIEIEELIGRLKSINDQG